jgi:hypothetical protein
MCHPAAIPIATAVIGGLSSGVQYAGQRQQAKAQQRFQAQAQAAERQRFQQEQTSMRMRQAQEQEAVGREMEQLSLRTRQAISRTKENPYATALVDDYLRQEGAIRASLLRQQELSGIATGLGLEQAGFATQQRQIRLSQPIERPSPLSGILGVASGALGGARTGLTLQSMMGSDTSLPSATIDPKITTGRSMGSRYRDFKPL